MQTCGHTGLFTWVLNYNLMPSSYCSKYCYTLSHLSSPLNFKSAFLLDRSVHQQTKYSQILLCLFAKQSEAASERALLPLILFFQTLGIFSLHLKPKHRFAVTLLLHNLDIYNLNWPNERVKSKTPDIPERNGLSLQNGMKLCSLSFYKQKQQEGIWGKRRKTWESGRKEEKHGIKVKAERIHRRVRTVHNSHIFHKCTLPQPSTSSPSLPPPASTMCDRVEKILQSSRLITTQDGQEELGLPFKANPCIHSFLYASDVFGIHKNVLVSRSTREVTESKQP